VYDYIYMGYLQGTKIVKIKISICSTHHTVVLNKKTTKMISILIFFLPNPLHPNPLSRAIGQV